MVDEVFGQIEWDDIEERWATAVAMPGFRDFGSLLPGETADRGDADVSAPLDLRGMDLMEAGKLVFGSRFAEIHAKASPEARVHLENSIRRFTEAKGPPARTPASRSSDEDDEPTDEDPMDPAVLFRQGKFRLSVVSPGGRKRPTSAQREAWQRVYNGGDALWEDVLRNILAVYRSQRPNRVRWAKAIFPDRLVKKALPDVKTVQAIKKHIRPYQICVLPAPVGEHEAQVGIQFACTWHDDFGVGVVLSTSGIRVGPGDSAVLADPAIASIQVPGLGALRRLHQASPWLGTTRCDPFLNFFDCALRRAAFRESPDDFSRADPQLPWDFANGEFDLVVFARKEPTSAQAQAWEAFREQEQRNAEIVMDALLAYYRSNVEDFRRTYRRKYAADVLPSLEHSDGLANLVRLAAINVHAESPAQQVSLGFEFSSAWGKDLGVRWCAGEVVEVGMADVARPAPEKGKGRVRISE